MQKLMTSAQPLQWQHLSYRIAQVLLLYGVILLPSGAGHMNEILISTAVFAFLSGQIKEKWSVILSYRTTSWTFVFTMIIVLSMLYTKGSMKYAWEGFFKYEKILFFLAYLPLFSKEKYRELVLNVFVLSALLSVLIILSGFFQDEPLINPIDSSFIVAFTSFILLRRWIEGGSVRWLHGVLFLFLAAYLLFYNIERTGYVLFLGGLGTVFWQYFRWRGALMGLVFVLGLIALLYQFSPSFQHRINLGIQEARSYAVEDAKMSHEIGVRYGLITEYLEKPSQGSLWSENFPSLYSTYLGKQGFNAAKRWFLSPHSHIRLSSIGLRLGFLQYSWRDIKKHPLIGNGNGSFYDLYWAGGGPTICEGRLGHPHNEYVFILFQFGIVGLLVFVFWQLAMWRESFELPLKDQYLLQGLLVCFALLGFCNASLFVNPSGVVFVILFSLFLASKKLERGSL